MGEDDRYARGNALFARAKTVIPGGIYGHQTPALLTRGAFPHFIEAGEGCRIRDVDGNEYIDFLCGYGPIVLGYRDPYVEAAVDRQRALGDTFSMPSPRMIELAERFVALTPGIDWAMFAKNGSDVCTWATAIARHATGRELIATVEHTYHGVHGWCNHLENGFPAAERASVRQFRWNDIESLEALFADERGRIAAVMVTPFRHELGEDSSMPADGFHEGIRRLCDREDALFIVDDVRAGFRMHMGGSVACWGVEPDLLVYSKAIGNGYALSALLGNERARDAAAAVFMTGTAWLQAVPIAASLATLERIEETDAIGHMNRMGDRLCEGLRERAAAAGLEVTLSGPPSIPFMTFVDDDKSFERSFLFAGECALGGVFLPPLHNWFLSAAHGPADIDEALVVAERAFRTVAARF